MLFSYHKTIYKLLGVLLLATNCYTSQAQYIIEGAKYRSIRDSLLGIGKFGPQTDLINSISVSGELNSSQPYLSGDQLLWEKIEPITNKYQGKKIKKILVQHSSGKAIIFLKGNNLVNISETDAEKEGLLSKTTYSEAEIITIDSPLYIGDKIPVYIKKQKIENKLVALQAGIKSTTIPHNYELQSYLPGNAWVMEIGTDGKTKKVYAYHLLQLPEESNPAPDFFAGNIRSVIPDYNLFKKQDSIVVTNGYRFSGGALYFTTPGYRNVLQCTISSPSLFVAKPFINICLPGATIVFDNVTLLDSSGKKTATMGKSYTLIDKEDIRQDYSGLISYPSFVGGSMGLYSYVAETLIRLPDIGLTKGKFDFSFIFMVEPDGTLTDVFRTDLYGKKDKVTQACYDLVKHSTTWIPGTYKGEKKSMLSNITFSIEIK